jgi:hypothetical protein
MKWKERGMETGLDGGFDHVRKWDEVGQGRDGLKGVFGRGLGTQQTQ